MTEETTFGFLDALLPQEQIFLEKVCDLRKTLTPEMKSNQGRTVGRMPHPINFENALKSTVAVTTHAVCIMTKRDAIVGLGFETEEERMQREKKRELDDQAQQLALQGPGAKPGQPGKPKAPPKVAKAFPPKPAGEKPEGEDPFEEGEGEDGEPAPGAPQRSKVAETLDPLCEDGFQHLMNQVGEDYETCGNGYIEVVRDGEKINALWHMPAGKVSVVVEGTKPFFHYEVDDEAGTLKYARFGDLDGMKTRTMCKQEQITELIHFKYPTSKHPKYGIPGWLSCVPWLELAQMIVQYNFDYFQNRAVPDLLLMITGAKVPDKDMKALSTQLKATIGSGNRFRSVLANVPDTNAKVELTRLRADNQEKFTELWTTIELEIVSAHRVPPLLAGVVLPGKMAAANELPNALIAFQTLYVAQHQGVFELKLGQTLGSKEAGLGLQPTDFLLKKITDFYDMGQVETMSRMRETATDAQVAGRKLEDGLKD